MDTTPNWAAIAGFSVTVPGCVVALWLLTKHPIKYRFLRKTKRYYDNAHFPGRRRAPAASLAKATVKENNEKEQEAIKSPDGTLTPSSVKKPDPVVVLPDSEETLYRQNSPETTKIVIYSQRFEARDRYSSRHWFFGKKDAFIS